MPLATTGTFAQRYRTVGRLGSGGMATVFLAEDERLGRLVAVKRLHGESSEEVARRFRREARLGAALNHPNVVAVYDITADDEGTLIVMEYVEGQTLRDEIGDGPIEPGRAIAILRGVAAALDYAHGNGVVHRDVKPANVLIRRDGVVKLADLGIAFAAEHSKITRSGAVLGTAAYMAPERLDGKAGGPAVDVYALAALSFEMLCGRKAYDGNTPLEVAHKVVNEPTPDLRECLKGAPDELAEALMRGLAWKAEDRPASAGELVSAIEAALPEAAAAAVVEPAEPDAPPPVPDPTRGAGGADAAASEPEADSTPARVLPPERVRTRPAARAASAAALGAAAEGTSDGAAPATTAGSDREPPPSADRVDSRSRRRWDLPLIAAALGVVALLAIVLITAGGDEESPSGEGDRAERVSPAESEDRSESKSKGGGEDEQGGQAPAAPEGDGGAGDGASPAAGTPEAAVNDFYTRAAAGDYQGAWELATPNARQKLGGFESFSAGQSSLESITFPKLKGTESGDTATVDLNSQAVHSDRIDRCKGSVDLVRSGGTWMLDDFHIATCAKTPRP